MAFQGTALQNSLLKQAEVYPQESLEACNRWIRALEEMSARGSGADRAQAEPLLNELRVTRTWLHNGTP
jgi:hypothetical protein